MTTTAMMVAVGDRLLHDDIYYNVVKRVSTTNGRMVFSVNALDGDGESTVVDLVITLPSSHSVAYQKRLE